MYLCRLLLPERCLESSTCCCKVSRGTWAVLSACWCPGWGNPPQGTSVLAAQSSIPTSLEFCLQSLSLNWQQPHYHGQREGGCVPGFRKKKGISLSSKTLSCVATMFADAPSLGKRAFGAITSHLASVSCGTLSTKRTAGHQSEEQYILLWSFCSWLWRENSFTIKSSLSRFVSRKCPVGF